MKSLLSALVFLVASTALAEDFSNIIITTEDGSEVKIEWLGTEVDESEVEAAWEIGGQNALYFGTVCYNGKTDDVKKILNSLSDSDFLGDEYRIQNIVAQASGQITYEVYDGPNEVVATENSIEPCGVSTSKNDLVGDVAYEYGNLITWQQVQDDGNTDKMRLADPMTLPGTVLDTLELLGLFVDFELPRKWEATSNYGIFVPEDIMEIYNEAGVVGYAINVTECTTEECYGWDALYLDQDGRIVKQTF